LKNHDLGLQKKENNNQCPRNCEKIDRKLN